MGVENGPRGASVANSAANMMMVCGLVSVSSRALAKARRREPLPRSVATASVGVWKNVRRPR
ncbi:hypothetical protein D3C85_1518480 [compost metagenome]